MEDIPTNEQPSVTRQSLGLLNKQNNWHVYMVNVPRSLYQSDECLKAKLAELEKLKEFDAYIETEYTGQACICTRC